MGSKVLKYNPTRIHPPGHSITVDVKDHQDSQFGYNIWITFATPVGLDTAMTPKYERHNLLLQIYRAK